MRFSDLTDFLLDLILPPVCLACRRRGQFLCDQCRGQIKINNSFFCAECGARLPESKKICHPDSYILGAAGSYDNEVLRELVHGLKYNGFKTAAPILAEILLEYFRKTGFDLNGWAIAPIPLYSSKERKRGFNQARLIAEEFIKRMPEAILADVFTRIRNTKSQTEFKDASERSKNVEKCFEAVDTAAVSGKKVLILDDVFTSGATMREAVKTLRRAGARRVIGLVIAKA